MDEMHVKVQSIIRRRAWSTLIATPIVIIVGGFVLLTEDEISTALVSGFSSIMLAIFAVFSAVNFANMNDTKKSYRSFNKIFYLNLSKVQVLLNTLKIISNTKDSLNPMHGYKKNVPSRGELASGSTESLLIGMQAFYSMRSAEQVEAYYRNLEHLAV